MRDLFLRALAAGLGLMIVFGIAATARCQTRTIRVATYNIEDDITNSTFHTNATTPLPGLIFPAQGGSTTNGGVLEGIGEEIFGDGVAQPLDIIALQETTSNPTTIAPIVAGMNAFYAVSNMYAMSTYQATEEGGDTGDGNGPNALVYNTLTLQLLASVPVDPPGGTSRLGSASGEYREVMRYLLAPAGVTPTASNEFYVYVSHYKSGTTSADLTDRAGEAQIIRNDSATLTTSARILYVGDYNVTASGETSYQTIVAAGVNQGIDPLNATDLTNVDWGTSTGDTTILAMESESATDLRYRDDFQMMTTNVYYGTPGGLAYVPGTYHVFGNNGTTAYYGSVNNGSDTALNSDLIPGARITASQLYFDLSDGSDHLPVVADYTVLAPQSYPSWQIQYFSCTNCSEAQPGADADGTGQNNLFKYTAGLNPTNPASVFSLTATASSNPPGVNLVFGPVASGHTYTPQFETNPTSANWQLLSNVSMATNGGLITLLDTNTLSANFYRLRISYP